MVLYYLKCFAFNTVMISSLCGVAYLLGDFTFLIIGTILINVIRSYVGGYHCKTLLRCILLTNFLFLICGLIVSRLYLPHILALVGFLILGILLCTFNERKEIQGISLGLSGVVAMAYAQGLYKIVDSIFLSLFLVIILILPREEGEEDG